MTSQIMLAPKARKPRRPPKYAALTLISQNPHHTADSKPPMDIACTVLDLPARLPPTHNQLKTAFASVIPDSVTPTPQHRSPAPPPDTHTTTALTQNSTHTSPSASPAYRFGQSSSPDPRSQRLDQVTPRFSRAVATSSHQAQCPDSKKKERDKPSTNTAHITAEPDPPRFRAHCQASQAPNALSKTTCNELKPPRKGWAPQQ